jgi:hypothetical protein
MKHFTRRRDMAFAIGVGEQSIVADAMKAGGQGSVNGRLA